MGNWLNWFSNVLDKQCGGYGELYEIQRCYTIKLKLVQTISGEEFNIAAD